MAAQLLIFLEHRLLQWLRLFNLQPLQVASDLLERFVLRLILIQFVFGGLQLRPDLKHVCQFGFFRLRV